VGWYCWAIRTEIKLKSFGFDVSLCFYCNLKTCKKNCVIKRLVFYWRQVTNGWPTGFESINTLNFTSEWDIYLCRNEEVCTKLEAEINRKFVPKFVRNRRIIIYDNTGHSRKWGLLRKCSGSTVMRLFTVQLDMPMSTVSKVCTEICTS